MRLNQRGISLIKQYEGLKLQAYLCPANVWTIGYGHTGPEVKPGLTITEAEADHLLRLDLARFEKDVRSLTEGLELTENQFSALVSFAYNCGSDIDADNKAEGLGDSTLLKKLKAGNIEGAANEFLKWVRGGGVILPGLVKRRDAERKLFLS